VLLAEGGAARADKAAPDFRQQVQPLLERCAGCHHGAKAPAGLVLTTRAGALRGGESGPAVVAGQASRSLLYQRAAAREMPPDEPLTADQVEVLGRWIAGGAPWEGTLVGKAPAARREPRRAGRDWWSFQPLTRPTPPAAADRAWVRNPIDAFVLARLESHGLAPAPEADRTTLIRRVTYDLLGLPPTPAEIDAYVNDPSPAAYEHLVDRLLASPHYGERWGRHWLDVARFGESHGFEFDRIREHAWRYRDYVIASLNSDKPYAQFVREQIAGDVLEPVTAQGIVATGFLVAGPWDEANQIQQSSVMRMRVREEELEDMISAVSQTFVAMTVNCARCHNHKFDPIPQQDYYRLKAVFEGVQHGDRAVLPPEEARAREAKAGRLTKEVRRLEEAVAAIDKAARDKVAAAQAPAPAPGLPVPMALWNFESDARDALGSLHGTLQGGAVVADGRLRLNGTGAYLESAPLPNGIRDKTLEAWVALANLQQRGGGIMTVERTDGSVFDAIVFGEREPGKWMAGSNFFVRTRDLAAPAETARPGELVHVAVVYQGDRRISVFRNGVPYGAAYEATGREGMLPTYAVGESRVLLGLRHHGAGNGFLAGEIEEARLYARALSSAEVAASYRAGVTRLAPDRLLAALTPEQRGRRASLTAELAKKRAALQALPPVALAYAANAKQPGPTFLLVRGDVQKQREQLTAGALSAVRTLPADFGLPADGREGARRLRLADWIASPDNPLSARVLVNRLWHYHLGRGLVASPSDFGFNGDRPTHPELLDWLAGELLAHAGRWKAIHRLIVCSNTYRQSTRFDARAAARDADNRWLWRFAPRRLEGEAVRDAMLAVSGQLNPRLGGPGFRPFTVSVFGSNIYQLTDPVSPEFNRRTVYRIQVNSAKSPLLDALDCPDPSVKAPRRSVTTTPLQALELMNNSFVLRQSQRFAERVAHEAGPDPAAQVHLAYRLSLGRCPSAGESQRAAALAQDQGLESLAWVLFNASEFLYQR
jgi:hypothetical protein